MEIIDNRALKLSVRRPERITSVIPKSKVVAEQDGVYDVLVHWGYDEVMVLKNLGIKNAPSPILKNPKWPGLYTPFDHQKDTASFLTMHRRAYCLNEQGCVDSETEYLSPTGWVKISDYSGGQVAQYHPDTRAVEFVDPIEYVKLPCDEMIHFKTKYGIDQMLSPEHRMLIHDNASKTDKWAVMSAADMLWRHDMYHSGNKAVVKKSRSAVGFYHAACPAIYNRTWGDGLPLSEAELRLQVAVIADGHFPSSSPYCVIRVKKQRKVDRLRSLLVASNIEFKEKVPEYESAKGFHVFTFFAPMLHVKAFDATFYNCSQAQIDVIYDEVLHWDGCFRQGNRFAEFCSTSKVSADFVQMVFNSKGHIARITEDRRDGKYRGGVCYTVTIRDSSSNLLSYRSNTETVHPCQSTDGFKYCFMVPSTFLLFRRNGCVFASGNTGKTNAILWATDYLMNQGYVNRALIICPLSIMRSTWQADAFKTVTHRSIDVAHGNRTARAKIIESDASIVVINFDGVEIVLDSLVRGKFDLVVIDEANFVKNAKSKRWAAINSLIGPDTWLWMATGTPASQSPLDAYGLAKMMNPNGVPKFFGAFRDTVMNKITMFKYAPKPGATEYVHKLLQPAIRYTKEECMDLPEMLYTTREVPLTTQQAKYYKQLKEHMRIEAAGEEITTVNAAVNLNKLLQVSSGSAYTDDGEVLEFDASNRLTALEEIIAESSHKVLVFANFRHGIDLISKHLTTKGITNDVIHGGVNANKRTVIFDKFQTTPDPHVLVIQPQSASHGVTLTAANTVVWWGPVTSYETYVQANARVHRAGQKNPSLVVHITGSPVENKLYSSLQAKEKMQDSLMSLYAEEINS